MVEFTTDLDIVFNSLADPIRRDIMQRLAQSEYSVGELVACYDVSFAAISKHLTVLEEANLVYKRKDGRKRLVSLVPGAFGVAAEFLALFDISQKSH